MNTQLTWDLVCIIRVLKYTDKVNSTSYVNSKYSLTRVTFYILEYGYGGHDRSDSGIFDMIPKDVYELGDHYRYR